jgi:hypothetical protein
MVESDELRRALSLAQEEGRARDTLVRRNQQLESARHFDRVAQASCNLLSALFCLIMNNIIP